jgi:drug/metabolite transporter (DMT)-like permease
MTQRAQSLQERRKAVFMLLLANLFWGLSFPVIKAITLIHAKLLPDAGPWFSTLYTVAPRFVLATFVMALALRGRIFETTRLELRQGITMGLFTACGMLLQNDGLQFTAASTSAFLTQLYAILIPLWLAIRARHNPGTLVWTCCIMVLTGVAILGHFNPFAAHTGEAGPSFGRGEWETLLSSLFFMGQILWLERKEYAASRPERLTFVIFATEAVVFGVLTVAVMPNAAALAAPFSSGAWIGLHLMLTFLSTIAAFFLMNAWQPKITATEAGLIYCVEPIFGSAMALFLPAWFSAWAGLSYQNEHLTLSLLIGGGLITFANLLIQTNPPTDK